MKVWSYEAPVKNVVAVVLGGGRGTRLLPLTSYRAKPAVPLAGKYRLIDIPISNCINSEINQVYVLTQFQSVSLHRHIRGTYRFDNFSGGFVELLAAQQTMDKLDGEHDWYQGTADAVRKNLRYLLPPEIKYVLILSGDQLYRMDFREMIETHEATKADVTIAAKLVDRSAAGSVGIIRTDSSGRAVGFLEKPKTEEELKDVVMDPAWLRERGFEGGGDCLASMGIYLFNRETLVAALEKTNYPDFGKDVFPATIRSRHVQLHVFDGYWEDIGTIRSFYDANLQLAQPDPPFELASADSPIYTRARSLPPTRVDGATIHHSLVSDGCVVGEGTRIENCVIGLRCRIGRHVTIRNSVIMGSDNYESPDRLASNGGASRPPIGIGDGSLVENAIVDKNCHIGRNVEVIGDPRQIERICGPNWDMLDGIMVVPKNAILPDGWRR
jgi:glucose-1-phosphate adenylyltransferase